MTTFVLDAGPLIALLDADEQYHAWAVATIDGLEGRLITCEAVLSEAWFLARRGSAHPVRVLELVAALSIDVVPAWSARASELLAKYEGRASVADACLLALLEIDSNRAVVTLDRVDFSIYRTHRDQAVPALMPPA